MTTGRSKSKYGLKELRTDRGDMTFAKMLATFRFSQDWTQEEMGQKLGLSRQNVCDYEKGRKIPTASLAAKMAKKVGDIEAYWVKLALEDMLKKEKRSGLVEIKARKKAG